MRLRSFVASSAGIALALLAPVFAAAARPELDVSADRRPAAAATALLARARSDPALARQATIVHVDERYGVPSFVRATRPSRSAPVVGRMPEQAARDHLVRLAPFYRLDEADVRGASVRYTHDTGRGGIIVSFRQTVDGLEVFRDEMKVMMDRDLELVAVSGYLPSKAATGKGVAGAFRIGAAEAIGLALDDFAETAVSRGGIRRIGPAPGGYEWYAIGARGQQLPAGLEESQQVRSKKVLFHLPAQLVPAYYLEVIGDADATAYVVSAVDGGLLFRHSLLASDSYTYRGWADATAIRAPFDGPQGNAPTPHPTGTPDFYMPSFLAPTLTTLQNGPISTNDPWLPPAATETNGNNVDAYVDLFSPDGFSAGDFRAATTSPGTFDRVYDTSVDPGVSANQRMAAITQLFYTNNFLHDWFYDAGFDEASGNGQTSNFGRGGVEGDNVRAEAQDYNGLNNANMATPADGGRPRMQMFVWNPASTQRVTVNSPGSIAGDKAAGYCLFGPQSYSVTADVVLVNDGSGTVTDACQPIVNAVAGKIALIDVGTCTNQAKICAAQAAGAVGVIIANNTSGTFLIAGSQPSCAVTIPTLVISLADANAIKTALTSGTVNATLFRQASVLRDGTIDNSVVAHEWGHYLSNRLIGNSIGLSNNQGGGMGEGWSDFVAMLLMVKPEDALVGSNPNWTGTWGLAQYALHNSLAATNIYYFGLRRYPYSTDFNKFPLTFQHIQQGVPLPPGPPVNTAVIDGSVNHLVHRTGEVWCNMLWECYASLLRDTGRLTFDQARDRMREYLVAGLKMTPNAPTILEARDALLAAAYASDPADFALFCAAFALRGAGVGAVGPDRHSTNNVGVTESYVCGGNLELVSAVLDDAVHSCDSDGYLDEGEVGYFTVTLKNTGSTNLSATTATLSSTNPSIVFQSGPTLSFPPSQPFGTTTAAAFVRSSGASGAQTQDIQIQFDDPGLAVAGPRIANTSAHGNVDEMSAFNENVEARTPPWTFSGPVLSPAIEPWRRLEVTGTDHRFYAPGAGGVSDQSLVSPPLQLGAWTATITFQHAWSQEVDGGLFFDGGVIEITDNGGGSWTDLGPFLSPGYNGTIYALSGNPLGGRSGFVGQSAGYPALAGAGLNLGTAYAGKTVQIRFRLGSDAGVSAAGWTVDNLALTGSLNAPFLMPLDDPGPCTPVAVDAEPPPAELTFDLASANPGHGRTSFRFALPRAARMRITIHDVTGRRVATVADGDYPAGVHEASWTSGAGGATTPGVYFARMATDGREITRRLVVLSR